MPRQSVRRRSAARHRRRVARAGRAGRAGSAAGRPADRRGHLSSGTRRPAPGEPGCSAVRWPARPWSPRPARCRRSVRCTRCTPTSYGQVTRTHRSPTPSTGCATAGRSPPGGCSPSSTGRTIFAMSASFQVDEPGLDHQLPIPDVPDPESLPTLAERIAGVDDRLVGWRRGPRAFDLRYVVRAAVAGTGCPDRRRRSRSRSGSRRTARCPTIRCCTSAWWPTFPTSPCSTRCSSSTDSRRAPTTCRWRRWTTRCGSTARSAPMTGCSTTPARPTRPAPAALGLGYFFGQDGQLLATVMQEGLVRLR